MPWNGLIKDESGRLGCGWKIERKKNFTGRRKNCCVVGQMLIKIYLIYCRWKVEGVVMQ
jgi:hypothetical protein